MNKKKTLFLLAVLLLLGVSITPHSYALYNETNIASPILSAPPTFDPQSFVQDKSSVTTEPTSYTSYVSHTFYEDMQMAPDKLGCQVDWWDWFDVLGLRDVLRCGIIGDDDRQAVENTTEAPWRVIVSFDSFFTNGTQGCTGFFIDPHTIATAAHCLYDRDTGFTPEVRLYPARNGNDIPYGSYTIYDDSIFVSSEWLNGQRETEYDYGAIVLPNDDLGNQVSWFNLVALSDQELENKYLHTAGYPFGTFNWDAICIFGHCKLMRDEEPMYDFDASVIRYTLDTIKGQSGSAIWYYSGNTVNVVGIVSNYCNPNIYNCAPRITQSIVNDFQTWSSRPGPASLNFTVKLENPQSVANFNHGRDVAIVVLEPRTEQILWGPAIVTTDANGYYGGLSLSGIPPGVYDLCAKARHYLGQCARNVNVNAGLTIKIDFSDGGSTPAWLGDIDAHGGDNEMNTLDLRMIDIHREQYIGQTCPPCTIDLNQDGIFNSQDVALVVYRVGNDFRGEGKFNFPFSLDESSVVNSQDSKPDKGAGTIKLDPDIRSPLVGMVFTISIILDTGGYSVTGADIRLHYDPGIFEILDEDSSQAGIQINPTTLFPSVTRNRVDTDQGIIWFSSAYSDSTDQFNGSDTVARFQVRAIAASPSPNYTMIIPVVDLNVSNESNSPDFNGGFDVLNSSSVGSYVVLGTPERVEPSMSLYPVSNSILRQTVLEATAEVDDPYNQVECVGFILSPDSGSSVSERDCEGADGWRALIDTSSIPEQTGVELKAYPVLRTTLGGYSTTNENITLDRTNPDILSTNFPPANPSPGESAQVALEIDDNLSQQIYAEMWINRANDSSQNGQWVRVDEAWIARSVSNPPFVDTMTWDTTGFDEGDHLIAITIQDDAGNWNSWSTVQTVGSSATCPGQYRAEYYSNQTLSGIASFNQCEGWPINHDWAYDGPGGIAFDNFSVRWMGRATIQSGNYDFIYRSDDGMRVWLNDELIIDEWDNPSFVENRVTRSLSTGEYQIRVEYYENAGAAIAQFRWEQQAPTSCPGQFLAQYYSNQTLSGNADLVQCESWPINHDWTSNPPAPNIPSGNFSARWTGNATFQGGDVTFIYRSDDGMRVWLDNELIIDNWDCPSLNQDSVTRYVSSGEHEIKVEYYESGGAAVAQFGWQSNRSHRPPFFPPNIGGEKGGRRLDLLVHQLYLPAITVDSSSNCAKR